MAKFKHIDDFCELVFHHPPWRCDSCVDEDGAPGRDYWGWAPIWDDEPWDEKFGAFVLRWLLWLFLIQIVAGAGILAGCLIATATGIS